MRRTVTMVLTTVVLIPGSALAQSVQLGLRAGAAMSSMRGGDATNARWREGFTDGLVLVIHPPATSLGFEVGLSYTEKGTEYPSDLITTRLKTTYLDLPVLLRVRVPLAGTAVRPVLLGGATLSLNAGCVLRISAGSQGREWDCDDPSFEGNTGVRSSDFGVTGGVAVDLAVGGRLVLSPQATYTMGLGGLYATADYLDVRNEVAQFQVGIRFR